MEQHCGPLIPKNLSRNVNSSKQFLNVHHFKLQIMNEWHDQSFIGIKLGVEHEACNVLIYSLQSAYTSISISLVLLTTTSHF